MGEKENDMKRVFAPGCALMLYKPELAERLHHMIKKNLGDIVYCVSCSKSMFIGGKKPHYLIDLLFGEETVPKTFEPDEWHRELDEYIDAH